MKVLLLQDVAKIGKKYEVKELADGYARNVLIPLGKAVLANDANMKKIAADRTAHDREKKARSTACTAALSQLNANPPIIRARANEKGGLFSGIAAKELSALLFDEAGVRLPYDAIKMRKPLKETGTYEIAVACEDGAGMFTLTVERA